MNAPSTAAPLGLLAELTHRCPLACPYCSNPLRLEGRRDELDTETWCRVLREAAALGVLQLHLSGGEPAARKDLIEITAAAHAAGLYTNLITSGVGLSPARLERLAEAGLDHIQVSIQDSIAESADRIAGCDGAFVQKRRIAEAAKQIGLRLTINAVIHRHNAMRVGAIVAMAAELGAERVEIAHVQYYGWAIVNRGALLPSRAQAEQAVAEIEELRAAYRGRLVIDAVTPDYFARFPKACMGGWGTRSLNVTPSGRVLPCHAAETIPALTFWNVREHSLADIWHNSPAFQAFRGTGWMKEPCTSCPRREQDFGGCRCQAFAITGDAAAADPVCHLSPAHDRLTALADEPQTDDFVYRRFAAVLPA
jgi:pyrroloquinoline quinone biosynthesis protein E